MEDKHVPRQEVGRQMDAGAVIRSKDIADARKSYEAVKERLLKVYDWYRIAKVPVSVFILADSEGREVKRAIKEGDLVKIDIPGPGPSGGDGYDWVRVERILEEQLPDGEIISVTLRPAPNPLGKPDNHTDHFFDQVSTSTLLVKRVGLEIRAEFHGRNEVANTHPGNFADKVRNFLVAIGAKLGLAFPQWKSLVEGLVDLDGHLI